MSQARPSLGPPMVPPCYIGRIATSLAGSDRVILGLVGPPGAGKSTLAQALRHAFPEVSQVVPMDGFHLAQVELDRLGRAARKGAPDTFDSAGYAALLSRMRRQQPGEVVYAPEFRRDLEEPVAGAIPVLPQTRLVITEGNYLLLDSDCWPQAAMHLDEIWYVQVDDAVRVPRLLQRHQDFGRTAQAAREWVAATDAPNSDLVAATRSRATIMFDWNAR